MTDSATTALLCCRNCERLSDSGRARVGQNSVRARVKIFLHPGEILASLLPGSAVATGGFATDAPRRIDHPHELRDTLTSWAELLRGAKARANKTRHIRHMTLGTTSSRLAETTVANHSKNLTTTQTCYCHGENSSIREAGNDISCAVARN